jgi:hypothetical protein
MEKSYYLCYGSLMTIFGLVAAIPLGVWQVILIFINPINLVGVFMSPHLFFIFAIPTVGIIMLVVGIQKEDKYASIRSRFYKSGVDDVAELTRELIRLDGKCPHCDVEIDLEMLRIGRCSKCLKSFDAKLSLTVTCAHCGATIPKNITNCSECGKPREG